MKNFKKLFAVAASVMMLASTVPTAVLGAASYSDELQGAYDYAYGIGVTTQSSIDNANMFGTLLRSHMAKMMVNYAKEVKGLTADTSLECEFTDIANQTEEMQGFIKEACQMGLMGVGITAFNPNGVVTRAQFGTVLSRVLYGTANDGGDPYYADHLAALKDAGIMNNISNPNAPEVRGYVMLMMQRAAEGGTNPAVCDELANQVACGLGLDTCPAQCQTTVETNGNLDVKLGAVIPGGDIPKSISSLPVVNYKFTADEDVRLDTVVLKRLGYFDTNTVNSAALFINGGRVSKVANFSSSTDEATLTIANGYEIKAGETVTITVHAVVGSSANQQFSIKLLSIGSTAKDVNLASNLTSETFKTLDTLSPTATLTAGNDVEAPKAGQSAADLFNFTLAIPTSAGINDHATLQSVTFKENGGTIDEATELQNFKLVVDGTTIATAAKMTGKYLIFNVANGYEIKEGRTPIFTVKADIIGASNDTIKYTFENNMDLVVMGDKYDQPMTVAGAGATPSTVTVSVGKVTVSRVQPTSIDLLRNRKNVFLGALEITDNADGKLKLQDIRFNFTGSELTGILDTVKIRLGSTSASPIELDDSSNKSIWSTTSLEKAIGSKLTVYVYADTLDQAMTNDRIRMSWSKTLGFTIQNISNDDPVVAGDISPASYDFSRMDGKDADVTLTKVVLGDKTVAKGAEGVEAMSFKMKAGSAYGAKIKKITFTGAGIDSDTVTNAVLMNGTTAIPAVVNNGTIVVDQDFTIAAGATANLVLKVDVASNPEVSTIAYSLVGAQIEAEDTSADQNTINLTSATTIVGRTITVIGNGEIIATYESTADSNKYTKNILAGLTATVAEYSMYSKYEKVNVGKAIVTFNAANTDVSTLDVQLWYNGTMVASNPTWTVGGTVATFTNLNFDTEMAKAPLLVKVITNTITDEGGATQASNYVTRLQLQTLKGKPSGEDVSDVNLTDDANTFGIVPVTLTPTLSTVLNTINIAAAAGDNTTGSIEDKATVTKFVFSVEGSNGVLNKITVKDSDGTTTLGSGSVTGDGTYNITVSKPISNGTTSFKVVTSLTGSTYDAHYDISLTNVQYTTDMDGDTATLDARMGASLLVITK